MKGILGMFERQADEILDAAKATPEIREKYRADIISILNESMAKLSAAHGTGHITLDERIATFTLQKQSLVTDLLEMMIDGEENDD
jgi:hypothetical protein